MLAVPGDQDLDLGPDRAGEDNVVGRVTGHGLGGPRCSLDRFHCQFSEQRLDLPQSLWVELKLLGEDALQLGDHGFEQDQLQAAVDRLL